ncbi:hypothetical protein Tco_0615143, partial [Tanacetum coccineum]
RLKANITIRVNRSVTISPIESSIHITGPNRFSVVTSLIRIGSHKSPTAVLFDVDTGRIFVRHPDMFIPSMTESYCPLQQSYVRLCVSSTNQHFKAPRDPSSEQLIINLPQQNFCAFLILLCPLPQWHIRVEVVSKSEVVKPIKKSLVNRLESPVTEFIKLINPH